MRWARLRGWLGVGCAVAALCASTPVFVVGQTPANSTSASAKSNKKTASTAKSSTKSGNTVSAKTERKSATNRARPTGHTSKVTSSTPASAHRGKSTKASLRKGSKKKVARGQQKIDPERAQAIQEALIREHYLNDQPSGTWNQATEEAMRRYQADHGWQSKTVPDSRALISLGLGPSNDHLLNPESAMTSATSASPTTHSAELTPVSHSGDPATGLSSNPSRPGDQTPAVTPRESADPQ